MRESLAALRRHIDCEFHYRMQTSFLWNNRHQSARKQNKYTKQTVLTLQRLRSFGVQSVAFNNTRLERKKRKRKRKSQINPSESLTQHSEAQRKEAGGEEGEKKKKVDGECWRESISFQILRMLREERGKKAAAWHSTARGSHANRSMAF